MNVTNDTDEIEPEFTYARIDTHYQSMAEQLCDLITGRGGVLPDDVEFTIHEEVDAPYMTVEAYVPDAEAFDQYIGERGIMDMFIDYATNDAMKSETLEAAIDEMDEDPDDDYEEWDWFENSIEIPEIDDYDRIRIQWDA